MLQRQGNCLAAGVLLSVEQWGKEGCGGVPKPASPPLLRRMQTNRWSAGRQEAAEAAQLATSAAWQEATGLNRKRGANWNAPRKHPRSCFALLRVDAVKH